MVDKIQKFLNKLSEKEKVSMQQLLIEIRHNRTADLDIKKLKGREDIYRARKGKIRIIYRVMNGEVSVLGVERRNDTTYNNF